MKLVAHSILIFLFALASFGQSADSLLKTKTPGNSTPNYFIPYSRGLVLNVTLTKDKENLYKRTFPYNASGLQLNADSTYVYYYVSKPAFELSAGNYTLEENIITLHWDSLKTEKYIVEPKIYQHYFMFKKPRAFKIENVKYILDDDKLIPYKFYSKFNRIDFLYTSKDLFRPNEGIDSIRNFRYNAAGDKLIISHGKNAELEISAEKIWGFVIYGGKTIKVYRRTPKGFNWYGIPGIQVVQLDKLIIYTVSGDRMYSYFSENLDSEIYPLNMHEVEKMFKNNKDLMFKLYREFGVKGSLTGLDDYFNSYKFIEVYRSFMDKQN